MTATSAESATNAEPATAELAPTGPALRGQVLPQVEACLSSLGTALAGIPAGRAPRPPRRDASRTRSEARLVFRAPLVGDEDDGWDGRRFSVLEVTSGLPDDSRASDEHERSRVEAHRRGRVAPAKAALAGADPEVAAQVFRDQVKLARFCDRFSIRPSDICPKGGEATERCSWCRGRHGGFQPIHVEDLSEALRSPYDRLAELRAREAACLPGSESWG